MQFPKWKRKVIFFLLFFFCLFLMETSYSFRIKMVGVMDQFTCCGIFLHAALARNKIVSDILENLWPDRKKDTKCCCGKLIMEILLFCIDFFTQFLFIFEPQYPRIQIFLKMHAFLCLYSFMSCNKVFQRSLSTTCWCPVVKFIFNVRLLGLSEVNTQFLSMLRDLLVTKQETVSNTVLTFSHLLF